MNTNEDLINKYLQNSLTKEEKNTFSLLLKNDAEFKEELSFQTNLKKVIAHEDDSNFRNLLESLEQKATTKLPKKGSFTKWMAAASVILVLGISFLLMQNNSVSTNDLFMSNFEPYRNVIAPVVRGEISDSNEALAFVAYESADYKKAISLFSNLYASTNESYYLFYQANALLKQGRAEEAIPLLKLHLKATDVLSAKTKWYLALAYLKNKDTQNARVFLKQVVADKAYKNKEAGILLKKLN